MPDDYAEQLIDVIIETDRAVREAKKFFDEIRREKNEAAKRYGELVKRFRQTGQSGYVDGKLVGINPDI